MGNIFLNESFHCPISCLGDDLMRFIEEAPFSAHMRKVETDQYMLCNQFSANNIGLKTPNEIVGLTPRDVIEHRLQSETDLSYKNLWKKKLAKLLDKTYQLSNRILLEKAPAMQQDIELTLSGFIRVTKTIRVPIFNHRKKIVAIASVDWDFASRFNLLTLYKFYRLYLPAKEAIQNFLIYLRVQHLFERMPSNLELITLLVMRENNSSNYVASKLNLSSRTIDEYKYRLKSKLVNNDLYSILAYLRTRNEQQQHTY